MLSLISFRVCFIAMSELFSRTSSIRTRSRGVVPVRGIEVTLCESPLAWLCGTASVAQGG